ncbi:hypothetical protein [Jiangella mangrovi]|uniref:Uncharacterized protein n=1 Tax=Jiangella mangrovi TaxID=1524084 RepID=A0A7W9GM76_9ACTN|nr:hypothetical protein [Jiangella mangrovi]MBB5786324.1 hypothetical protein [Jiangella mangrovi]
MSEILAELRRVFDGAVKDPDGYRIAYGYDSTEKNYLVVKRTIIHSFVVGYVPGAKDLAILEVSGEPGEIEAAEPLYVTASTLRSAKKDLQRRYVIRTTDGDKVRFTVLPTVPRLLQAAYVLGVEQRDEAAAFAEYFDTLR